MRMLTNSQSITKRCTEKWGKPTDREKEREGIVDANIERRILFVYCDHLNALLNCVIWNQLFSVKVKRASKEFTVITILVFQQVSSSTFYDNENNGKHTQHWEKWKKSLQLLSSNHSRVSPGLEVTCVIPSIEIIFAKRWQKAMGNASFWATA